MNEKKTDEIDTPSASGDGIDRRGMLKCMAWAGTGLLWTLNSGIPTSNLLAATQKKGGALRRTGARGSGHADRTEGQSHPHGCGGS